MSVLETRFRITDPGIFWSLQTTNHLANYDLSAPKISVIDDTYLDTKNRNLLAVGYICRRRDQDKSALVTLTKIESPIKSIQQPKIWEVSLENLKNSPANWPKSQVRARVEKVVKNKRLRTIFSLNQTRITRFIQNDEQVIGQANLDDVSLNINKKEEHLKTLKLKIVSPNPKKHLNTLIASLHQKWGLEPQELTKFELAITIETGKNL